MIEGIIGNIIFFGGMLGIVAYCFIRDEVLYHRYMKFYETTEEGRRLYYVQYELGRLKLKKCGFIKNQMQLKDKIDEYTTYMPDDNENREILKELKLQYNLNVEKLKQVKTQEFIRVLILKIQHRIQRNHILKNMLKILNIKF